VQLVFALAVVITNAHVLTMNPAQPTAKVVAVAGDRIAYVGDDLAAAEKAAPGAALLDAGGRTVMPGFNDAHVHFGLSLTLGSDHGIDLPNLDRRAFIRAVKRASAAHPDRDWLFIKIRDLPRGIESARDLAFISRPLLVVSAHGGILNPRARALGGFSNDEAPGGFIHGRDLATSFDRLIKALPFGRLAGGAHEFLAHLARVGITSVQLIDELPDLFDGLRRKGELTARIRFIPFGHQFENPFYVSSWKGPAPDWVRVEGVKYFDDEGARLPRWEMEEIFERSRKASRQVVVHVLSGAALESLLDGIEQLATADHDPAATRLWRIEHADEVTPEQARRLAKDGIIVCSNPSMIPEWHTESAFPMHTLLAAGVRTCIGTDWVGRHVPERSLSPMSGVELAVTHGGFGTAERITTAQALDAYTVGSATAEHLEKKKGSLRPGMFADLIVLSADPLTTPPEELGAIEVLMTMVGGRVVYRHGF
jgi:hypothetical protein